LPEQCPVMPIVVRDPRVPPHQVMKVPPHQVMKVPPPPMAPHQVMEVSRMHTALPDR
jgi:hypothetical protein